MYTHLPIPFTLWEKTTVEDAGTPEMHVGGCDPKRICRVTHV